MTVTFAALALVGASAAVQAQTAPQLLPYKMSTVAGGGAAAIAKGAICPVSGFTSTDAFGDGCLATEVKLSAPRFVTTDKSGTVFFSDSGNALVRRIDPVTGVITAVAGGASSSPSAGSACGTFVSLNSDGDGCLGTDVKISKPEGLAFSASGDLYFADNGYDNVRKVAATGGVITTTGVISNVAGSTTFGYNVNNTSPTGAVIAATQSYLNFPYGLTFDRQGNLYVADEGNNALSVINLTSATETIQGLTVPAGTIAKIAGFGNLAAKSATSGDCPDFVSTSSRGGCYFGSFTNGNLGVKSNVDSDYDVAVDAAGNVYFVNEFTNNVAVLSAGNVINTYAGIQSTPGTATNVRAAAGTFGIGSNYNVAVDGSGNLYTSDSVNGVVWRVDAPTRSMYVVAGGGAVCSTATNASGDGCPATMAKLSAGSINASGFATSPGVAGLFIDPFGSLYLTDASASTVRVASSGTQFGVIGNTQPTQTLDIHFAAGDTQSSSGYTLTAGSANFTLGAATCTANSDKTTDCMLPVTANPTALGAFSGTLQVTSSLGAKSTFTLGGTLVRTPNTRTAVAVSGGGAGCTGSTVFSTTAPLTFTATVTSSGGATGTVQFFANGNALGTPQTVTNGVATLTTNLPTAGSYTIKAVYSGDSFFLTSTGTAPAAVTTSAPMFSVATIVSSQSTVAAGQTGLYSFNLLQSVYNGTITLTCSGLPVNASCQFSPSTIVATGCSTTNTVAMSIVTQQGTVRAASLAGLSGKPWMWLSVLPGMGLALLIGVRRRRMPLRLAQLCTVLALLVASASFVGCGNGSSLPSTPSGTYSVTVTATGSTGTVASFTVPLTVK